MTELHRSRGRLLHHDPASRGYAAPPVPFPTKGWRHTMGPVLDQGRIGGCVGWSVADWLNSSKALKNRRLYNRAASTTVSLGKRRSTQYLDNRDGLFLYEQATVNDTIGGTYPPDDTGSTGLGAAKALQKLGVISQYLWAFDFATALGWASRQPIMVGSLWTDAMMDPDAQGVLHTGGTAAIKKAENDGAGHEYDWFGYDPATGLCDIRNHWTDQWGLKGNAKISAGDLETLIITYQGDVCVPEVL